jgi:nicotinamide-nucleotide amidase
MIIRIEERLGQLLISQKQTLSVVESCTGGLIQHRVTNISGSSSYFMGGFVTYSNAAKMKFAGVSESTLQRYGAVSEQTAREMVVGVQASFGVDYALSATGIVGPGGGSPEKPVGLVYVGLATPTGSEVRRFLWSADRETNKSYTADAALNWLVSVLENL